MPMPLNTFPGSTAPYPSTPTSSLLAAATSAATSSSSASSRLKINERTPFFTALHAASRLPRALMGGTPAMRAAGVAYLPKFPDELPGTWEARLHQTFLYNGYRIAHEAMVGKAFAKPIKLRPDVPTVFRGGDEKGKGGWAEDVDLSGNHLDVFAQVAFADSLHPGLGYILTSFPSRPPELQNVRLSASQQITHNLRPYFVYISADEDMLGVDVKSINGKEQVRRIRFLRRTMVEDGWGQREEERVHVWELVDDPGDPDTGREGEGLVVTSTIHKPPPDPKPDQDWDIESGPSIVRGYNDAPLRRIPISAFAAAEGPFLDDLAWKNLEHWQSSSDQRNILHVARVMAMAVYGMSKKEFEDIRVAWGPGSVYCFPSPKTEAGMEFVTYEGDVTIGERDLNHIEEQLVTLSLEPLLNRPGNPTATAKALDQARANSRLLAAVRRFADCLELALEYALVDYWGEDTGGSLQMNEDFGITISMREELRFLRESRLPDQKGQIAQISHEKYIEEGKRRGVFSEDTVAKDEWKKIVQERRDLALVGALVPPKRGGEEDEDEEDEADMKEGKEEGEEDGGTGMDTEDAVDDEDQE